MIEKSSAQMYIGRDDSEPVRTRVSEFANVRVYSNAEDKTAFPWLSELNTRAASRLNYLGERERERKRDDEDTRFAKNVDVVFITDAVEPAVELSALRVDFLLVEYITYSRRGFTFPRYNSNKQKLKLAIKMLTKGNPVTIKRATKRKTAEFNIPITKDDVAKEVSEIFLFFFLPETALARRCETMKQNTR